MSIEQVRIPDIGDASEVEIIELCVSAGDSVEVDDALIVIESDKASMEVPSPVAGKVIGLKVAVGDQCSEGDVIAEVELADAEADSGKDDGKAGAAQADEEAQDDEDAAAAKRESDAGDDSGTDDDDTETDGSDTGDADDSNAGDSNAGDQEGETRTVDVKVPDVGDAGEVVVVEVMVAVGDQVEVDDGLIALESDKATMEVPAPVAGKVVAVEVAEGDEIGEGTLVARIETRSAGGGKAAKKKPASTSEQAVDKNGKQKSSQAAKDDSTQQERQAPAAQQSAAAESSSGAGANVYAGPAVRMLARELGVQLQQVDGSGSKGRILKEDVHAFVKKRMQGAEAGTGATAGAGIPPIPEVDFSRFGEIDSQPISRIMRAGANNLQRSWLNVPHVTQHDEADLTDLEAFRKHLKPEAERAGVKVTPLPLIMKAVQAALAEFPRFNGSFAADGEHYVFKRYFHIGFAVDTPEGLLVPVVRDVDRKGVFELAAEIADLSERARNMKLKPDEMRGGCISISSLGNIGGTGFTPIVNAPEVAILGVSRLTRKPVWDGEQFVPRDMLPLSLSYDHRAINGAEAGRFMVWLCQALTDMRRLLL